MYKGLEVYCCLALNRIAQQLGIDLNQADLETKLDDILKERNKGVPKVELSYELRSNHYMTNKVLEVLEEEGLVTVEKVTDGREYQVKITKKGVLHIRKFNEFYASIYEAQIRDHYKYQELPAWFLKHKG